MDNNTITNVESIIPNHRVSIPIMSLFKDRERNANTTKVETIENSLRDSETHFSRYEIIKFLQELATVGCGKFVVGRRGQPSRFEWQVDARELSQALLEKTASHVDKPDLALNGAETHKGTTPTSLSTLNHRFNLRPDFVVTMILPVDLTSNEAQRLQHFIGALPMAPAQQSIA
jgi:hypothetical protein